jgi:hypothetical protein
MGTHQHSENQIADSTDWRFFKENQGFAGFWHVGDKKFKKEKNYV